MMISKFKKSKKSVVIEKNKLEDRVSVSLEKYQQFENLSKILKEISVSGEYNEFKDVHKYYIKDFLKIYSNGIETGNTETFGIKDKSYYQVKLIFCNIWHKIYQYLDKISQTDVNNYEDYLKSLVAVPDSDIYTINNSIDNMLIDDEIASKNMMLSVLNTPFKCLTNNILKGFTCDVSTVHYQVNRERFNSINTRIKSLDNDIKRFDNQIKLFSSNDFIKEKTSEPLYDLL